MKTIIFACFFFLCYHGHYHHYRHHGHTHVYPHFHQGLCKQVKEAIKKNPNIDIGALIQAYPEDKREELVKCLNK